MTDIVHVHLLSLLISIQIWSRKITCFILLLAGVNTVSLSQTTNFLPFTKLEIKNGLPGINVRKITKDKFGFMWFATQDGISRFDGKSYINLNSYNVNDKRKILGTDVYDIKPDFAGDYLWALSAYGGLSKIELATCNVFATYQVQQNVKPDTTLWYKCFAENSNYLIIGTNEGIISRFKKASGKIDYSFSLKENFNCDGQLEKIMIDPDNRVWYFLSGKGILVTDSTLMKKIAFISSSALDKQPFYFTDYSLYKNSIYLTTTIGLKIVDIKNLAPISPANREASLVLYCEGKELHSLSIDDTIAIVCGKNFLSQINLSSSKIQHLQLAGNYEDRSWITLTNSVYLDNQNIWIGSQYGVGWVRDINSPFVPYYTSFDGNNIKINHAITIHAVSDSILLVCGDDGLYSVNHVTSQIKEIIGNDFFYSVFPVFNGYFIASGQSTGLHLLSDKFKPVDILSVFPELKPIKDELMMCSAKLEDSIVFIASQNKNGLYIWNARTRRIINISTRSESISLRNDDINRLYLDSDKRLWIICENVVSIYDHFKKTITHLPLTDPSTKLPLSINMDICEMKDSYWLASYGTGVVELSKNLEIKRIYNAKDGINNLGLYKLYPLNDSMLIVSSNNGISVINILSSHVKNYFTEAGLQSNSFEEASGDKFNNFIFLGGIRGITKADISKFKTNQSIPRLTFSTITYSSQKEITDTLNIAIKKVVVPTPVTQLRIGFSAIYYSQPEQIKFAYRIIENDDNWNFTNQNFIQFFRLSPGTYHLQVQAFNEDGVASEIKELTLIFLPKWYQTWWFKLLIVLAAIGAVYGLYRIRINQLKKEQLIRTKLASDLHDDLGSTMNSVKVYANLALMERDNEKLLYKIKEGTQEAITGMKDMIWVLDDRKGTIEDLLARISLFADPLCEANKTRYKKEITDEARNHKLGQEEKRNLYMMLKESINNAIKYAEASEITITISIKKGKPDMALNDNGKGFDTRKATEGNGLKNMKRRAKEIKYDISINSRPGEGTSIHFQKI